MWTRQEVGATEYTEWQGTLSGMHSIMRVKSAQPGEGGGAERAETLPHSPL
jgi:hypothetical protein